MKNILAMAKANVSKRPVTKTKARVRTSFNMTTGVITIPLPKITAAVVSELVDGQRCPKCEGKGVHISHTKHKVLGVCNWCNDPTTQGHGKGWLSKRDIGYIHRRELNATLNWVKSA